MATGFTLQLTEEIEQEIRRRAGQGQRVLIFAAPDGRATFVLYLKPDGASHMLELEEIYRKYARGP